MIKLNQVFTNSKEIMKCFGIANGEEKTICSTAKDHWVHLLKMNGSNNGIVNKHGPENTAWDFISINNENGSLNIGQYPPLHAMFVQELNETDYTFKGVYELDTANSTEHSIIFKHIANEVDSHAYEWLIVDTVS